MSHGRSQGKCVNNIIAGPPLWRSPWPLNKITVDGQQQSERKNHGLKYRKSSRRDVDLKRKKSLAINASSGFIRFSNEWRLQSWCQWVSPLGSDQNTALSVLWATKNWCELAKSTSSINAYNSVAPEMHKEKKLPADSDPDSSLVQQSCSESDLWRKPRVAPQTEEEVSSLSVKTRERRINS